MKYNLIYLTNTPSFYKLNLCKEIAAKGVKLLVVFNGYGNEAVNKQLKKDADWGFDWEFLYEGDYWERPKFKIFNRLRRLLKHIQYDKLLFSGWMSTEYNLYSFLSPRSKNMIICESSKFEVSTTGLKGWVKRRIINRMQIALPSGTPHMELLNTLNFKGTQFITGSVGIFNMDNSTDNLHNDKNIKRKGINATKFLYVGRLTAVKNLPLLIECFNRNGLSLTIAGNGELEQSLKEIAKPNIKFIGFIDNDRLTDVYNEHDVFILPSYSEPWGLVVEEALYRGLPVIVSDVVGSGYDMVLSTGAGTSFKHDSIEDLQQSIDLVLNDYHKYASAASAIDFNMRKKAQVETYLSALKD